MNEIKYLPYPKLVYAKDLDDAYRKGYFSGSITRWELIDRITKHNERARVYSNATHRGLWIDGRFLCGITHNITVPKFTICKLDPAFDKKLILRNEDGEVTGTEVVNNDEMKGYVLTRSYLETFKSVVKNGYLVDLKGLLE